MACFRDLTRAPFFEPLWSFPFENSRMTLATFFRAFDFFFATVTSRLLPVHDERPDGATTVATASFRVE